MRLLVNFKNFNNISDLIKVLNSINDCEIDKTIDIELKLKPFNDLYLILAFVVWVNYRRCQGYNISFNISETNQYLQRINFYKQLGIDNKERFLRHNTECSLLEIKRITQDLDCDVLIVNSIIKILKDKFVDSISVINCLNYCLWELVDNVKHSGASASAYIVVQSYPRQSYIEIVLIDAGCGVYKSLSENEMLSISSESDALQKSVKQGITKGDGGGGNGLYQTVEFIKANKGEFILYSGEYSYNVLGGKEEIKNMPFWQGTSIFMKILTNVNMDFEEVFGTDNVPTSVEEFGEEDLW